MLTGRIFNLQHFSIHDGPGIRTTVFFKGCPLSCVWCHNPESLERRIELSFNADKCAGCGSCSKVCGHVCDRDKCTACGKCAEVCYYNAREIIGKDYTVDEVIANVMRDKVFYEVSGGGITLSGGEPMYQFEFAFELLKRAKEEGLHTCIETAGVATAAQFTAIVPYTDIFLYDYKESDPAKHKEFCGADNRLILDNLEMLNSFGCNIILRCPLIPDLNTRTEHLDAIADIANKLDGITEVNIEPYHPLGISKNVNIGKEPGYTYDKFMDKEDLKRYVEYIAGKTTKKVGMT